jgi:CheY-like chemotaxis protein
MSPHGTVMLIEDDPDVAEAVFDVLTDDGYEVTHACNGRVALELLGATGEPPSLILLDLMMPEMDGPEFRAAQLRDPRYADIPVVVLSADRHGAEKARELGAFAFVTKPLHPDQLVSVVEQSAHPPCDRAS